MHISLISFAVLLGIKMAYFYQIYMSTYCKRMICSCKLIRYFHKYQLRSENSLSSKPHGLKVLSCIDMKF